MLWTGFQELWPDIGTKTLANPQELGLVTLEIPSGSWQAPSDLTLRFLEQTFLLIIVIFNTLKIFSPISDIYVSTFNLDVSHSTETQLCVSGKMFSFWFHVFKRPSHIRVIKIYFLE